MNIWYEVYELYEEEKRFFKEKTIALCKYKYTAETVARYFPRSKIRIIEQVNRWDSRDPFISDETECSIKDKEKMEDVKCKLKEMNDRIEKIEKLLSEG